MCIEYNGKQHYEPIEWFGGEKTLNKIRTTDNIKINYCLANKIDLLSIRYDSNLMDILNSNLLFINS